MSQQPVTLYDAVGGEETFTALVRRFYAGVRTDPLLRPMYEQDDIDAAEERLRLFLIQYWGGPRTYSEQRGHPRLRMRHAPFPVDDNARIAWLTHMRAALDETDLPREAEAALWDYFQHAAESLKNVLE